MPNPFPNAAKFVASGVACDNESHGLIIHVMENYLAFTFNSVRANDASMEKDQKVLV